MPLPDFVQLYVKLRHPHHYDPASWPIALWLTFLWPVPVAIVTLRKHSEVMLLLKALGVMIGIALLLAGVFYVSETLIQLSLYRFSVYLKLLTCIGAALWMTEKIIRGLFIALFLIIAGGGIWLFFFARFSPDQTRFVAEQLPAVMIFSIFLAIAAAVIFWRDRPTVLMFAIGGALIQLMVCWPLLGLRVIPEDDAEYVEMCDWSARNTPADAVFLVPPGEQSMRWRGQRAIIVNFKGVPQLSRELPQWKQRMSDVLGEDVLLLPRGFSRSLTGADLIYEARPTAQLIDIAKKYGARYILVDHRLPEMSEMHASSGGKYFLYDLKTNGNERGTLGRSAITRPAPATLPVAH